MTDTIRTHTNELEVCFHHKAIMDDFDIYMIDMPFDKSSPGIKNLSPSSFFTDVRQKLKPLGQFVYTNNGRRKYIVLIPKGTPADTKSFSMRQLGLSEFSKLPNYGKLRLLLSLMRGEEVLDRSVLFEMEGNPYELYYIHPYTKERDAVVTLSPEIIAHSQEGKLLLSINVVAFRRISKPGKYPAFVTDGTILRLYNPRTDNEKTIYQKGNRRGIKKRTSVDFFTLEIEHFHRSKSSQHASFLKRVGVYLQRYVDIQSKIYDLKLYSGLHDKPVQKARIVQMIREYAMQMGTLHIAVLDETCRLSASALPSLFEAFFSEAESLFENKIHFTLSDRVSSDNPTISITREKAFYEENGLDDPYQTIGRDTPVQNITLIPLSSPLETSDPDEIMQQLGIGKEKIEVTFKELAVKCELYGGQPFIVHDKSITGIRYFSVEAFSRKKGADDPVFHKAVLHENGKMYTSEPTEEELARLHEAVLMHTGYKEYPEFAFIDKHDRLFLGIRTPLLALPDIDTLSEEREEILKPYYFQKEEILAAAEEIEAYFSVEETFNKEEERELCSREEFFSMLEEIETYKGIASVKLLQQNKYFISKKLKNRLSLISGKPMVKTLSRSKEGKKMFAGLLGIAYWYEGNTLYYHSHKEGYTSTNSKIERASPFRKVVSEYDSECVDIETVLPLLEHYFVRHKEITVLPYPVKYAREGYKRKKR